MNEKKPKVVLFCGGRGTRLKEETEFKPKPMVKIGNRPILWHIMKVYSFYGFNDFIICLGYKGEQIKEYFINYELINNDFTVTLGSKSKFEAHNCPPEEGWKIILSDTGEKALKGARLKRVEKYIDTDVFMATYGDGVANINLNELLRFHKSHGKKATLTGVNPPSRFGELEISGNQVIRFTEKPQSKEGLINGGFFILNREILNYLSSDDDCDLEYGVLDDLSKKGELMVYHHKEFWACMDTYRDMEYLNRVWTQGKAPWKVW